MIYYIKTKPYKVFGEWSRMWTLARRLAKTQAVTTHRLDGTLLATHKPNNLWLPLTWLATVSTSANPGD